METDDEAAARAHAVAEFKSRGGNVTKLPFAMARGAMLRRACERHEEYVARWLDKRAEVMTPDQIAAAQTTGRQKRWRRRRKKE